METLDEADHQALILWYCHQRYHNQMLQQSKQAAHIFPLNDDHKIFLAVSYLLVNRHEEALQLSLELMVSEDNVLSGLLIQSVIRQRDDAKNRVIVTQIDAKIRDERRKATYVSLTRASKVFLLLNDINRAKEYADRAYKLNSRNLDVLIMNGWIHHNKNYFSLIGNEHNRRFDVLLGIVKFLQSNNSYGEAILILNTLIIKYPKLSIPFIEKMICHLGVKDWDQVLETANRILSIDSNNMDAIKAKTIVILCRDGDYPTAIKNINLFFRNLLATEPKNIEIIINNTQAFSGMIDHNEEILIELTKIMEKLVQQNPNLCEPMVELGNIFLSLNKFKEAEHWYRNAIRINQSSFAALMGLAHCQVLNELPGSKELACQQIDFLIEIQANSLDPRLYFMSAKLYRNDSNKALNYLTMASKLVLKNIENIPYSYEYLKKLCPDFCLEVINEYLAHLPLAMTDNGRVMPPDENVKSSLMLLDRITDACPASCTAAIMLAKMNIRIGDHAEALIGLQKLLGVVDPTNAMGHLLMAQIYSLQKNYESASQSLEVGLSLDFRVRNEFLYHLINGMIEKANSNMKACIESLRTAMTLMDNKTIKDNLCKAHVSISDKATVYSELILAYGKLKKFEEANALMSEAKMQFVNTLEESRILIVNAEIYLESGDIEKAVNYLSDIQSHQPYYLHAHIKLAQIYLYRCKDRYRYAKCFGELVENFPGPKTYSMLGDAYMVIQEPDRAIEAYEQSLRENPSDNVLANKMAKALIKTHQYERAIDYYKEVVKNESCADLKLDMSELFMRMKQFAKAESSLVQELQTGPIANDQKELQMRVEQLIMLAKVQKHLEKISLSINTLKEAKEIQSRCVEEATIGCSMVDQKKKLAEICLTIADHCTVFRDFDSAIVHYKDALQNKSADVETLFSLAKLYMQINDLDRGAQCCTALLNNDPNNEAALVMMADLAFRKVDFDTAAYHFRQLLIRRPTYWTALARLIEISRRTGNIDDLNQWISRAEAVMPTSNRDAGFHYCSGLRDWRTGKLNSALKNFNAARRDPEWGQQAIYNMVEICLDPDDDSALFSEAFNEDDAEYQDSRTMALKTAQRLLQELNPKGSPREILTYRLLGNFFLLSTRVKTNIERALQDFTTMANQETLQDQVGPALGVATAHILLKQTPRARNHLKHVSKNVWTFEDAEYLEKCWLLLAEIYIHSNKYELASELLRKVLQHNATCVRAHELSGFVAEREQNYREAAECYSRAWKFGGKTKLPVGYKLAHCSFKSKRYADAIQACNEVLQQNTDFPRIRKEMLDKSIYHIRT